MENKKKLVILTGPTAVGKSDLSINLAKRINGEIISADSMQVYKGLNIGSAKITKEEMQGINHYLIDILDPKEAFNVFEFKKYATQALEDIYSHGSVPIIVGGTGFYIQAVLYDIDFSEEDNSEIRSTLAKELDEKGAHFMYEKLSSIDPQYALTCHENNTKRVLRALEYYYLNNKLFSEHNETERIKESPYDFRYFVLNDDRTKLYSNIEKRVDKMMEDGLLSEVKALYDSGLNRDYVSMQGLGYKELIDYFDGILSLDEAVLKIKTETRHFAKRQLTWFRREKDVRFINKNEFDYDNEKILDYMIKEIENDRR